MSKQTIQIAIFATILGTGDAHAFLGIGDGWDNEYCRITYADKGCGDDGFLIEFQNGSDSNDKSKDECKGMPWPKTAADLEFWANKKTYGNGILTRPEVEMDNQGNLIAMHGRAVKKCFNKKNHQSNKWSVLTDNVMFTLSGQGCQCASGTVAMGSSCVTTNPTGTANMSDLLETVTTGMNVIGSGNTHNTGSNEFGSIVNKDLMTAGGSLADQGLVAKTLDGSTAGKGAGDTGAFDPTKLAGGIVGKAGSDSSANKNGNSNGGLISLSTGGTGDGNVSLASITGSDGSYQFRGAATAGGNGGSDGGGRAFTGSDMTGGASLSGNGQTAGIDFAGGRGPASADGSDGSGAFGANGRLGEDPNDYFTRIGLGDNLFKIVEKRYRSQQTGWVLNQPSTKK